MKFLKLPDGVYDTLVWICITALPALSVAYPTLAGIWGWPFADRVPATIGVITMFLGTLLGISNVNYNRQKLEAITDANTEEDTDNDTGA